jgi:hypothetical protein
MALEIDINVGPGAVIAVPVPVTTTDVVPVPGGCRLIGWSLREASGELPSDVRSSVVAPGAGATIATTVALAAGIYDVQWQVELAGAAAAADANNFQLLNGATVVAQSVNAGVAGQYPQPNARLTVTQGSTISVQAIGAGTAGVTYTADISAVPDPFFGAVVELQTNGTACGESGMDLQDSDTQWFGNPGITIPGGVTVHVVAGTVTGTVYVAFD